MRSARRDASGGACNAGGNAVGASGVELLEAKARLREAVWSMLEKRGVARFPLPLRGRVPNFEGAEAAAQNLAALEEWRLAKVIVANPDAPQRPLRELALRHGKTLIMASPRLKKGYILLEPLRVKGDEAAAATIRGAFRLGKLLRVEEVPKPDLIITGCVAVDQCTGYRLGKGGGYGDVEIRAMHRLWGKVPVATTVHDLQIVENVPFDPERDTRVDMIATPTRILRTHAHAHTRTCAGIRARAHTRTHTRAHARTRTCAEA